MGQYRKLGWLVVGIVVLLTVALLTVGCGAQQPPSPTAPPTTVAPAPTAAAPAPTAAPAAKPAATGVIKIGAHVPLTGPYSIAGVPIKQVFQMVADQINDRGGVAVKGQKQNLELIWEDNKSTGEGGVAAVQKLVTRDKVQFLLGSVTDSTVASYPIAQANNVIYFSSAGGPDFLNAKNKLAFGYGNAASVWDFVYLVRMPKLFPEVKSVAFLAQDTGAARDTGKWMKAGIPISGLKLVAEEYYPADVTEFGPFVNRVLSKKPDAVAFLSLAKTSAYLVKELRGQGFKGLILVNGVLALQDVRAALSRDELEGLVDGVDPVKGKVPFLSPDLEQAASAYEKRHPDEPKVSRANGWVPMGLQILVQGIEKAQSLETSAVLAALESPGQAFDGYYGKVAFAKGGLYESSHVAWWRMPITQIQNGELVGIDVVSSEEILGYMGQVR